MRAVALPIGEVVRVAAGEVSTGDLLGFECLMIAVDTGVNHGDFDASAVHHREICAHAFHAPRHQAKGWNWNAAFNGKSVVIPDSSDLPVITMSDGMRLTLLSPTWPKLEKLEPVWERELRKAGLLGAEEDDFDSIGVESLGALTADEVEEAAESDFEPDTSEANGSSICVLAEFDGRRAVLTGDGHAELLAASLAKVRGNGGPIVLDAFKLSHHGSHGTHSVELMKQITAKRFLISTDGSRHKHPHIELIARTVKHGGGDIELVFNYESTHTAKWDVRGLKSRFGYETIYPEANTAGMIRTNL